MFWGKVTMSIVTIVLQVSFWPLICLLEHGTTLVGTTWPDKVDFPKEGHCSWGKQGMTVSTSIENKVYIFVWLDNKPVFYFQTRRMPGFLELLPSANVCMRVCLHVFAYVSTP